MYTAYYFPCEHIWRKLTLCRRSWPLALRRAMAELEVTREAPNNTTGVAETIGNMPDNSIAEKAGKPDPV